MARQPGPNYIKFSTPESLDITPEISGTKPETSHGAPELSGSESSPELFRCPVPELI